MKFKLRFNSTNEMVNAIKPITSIVVVFEILLVVIGCKKSSFEEEGCKKDGQIGSRFLISKSVWGINLASTKFNFQSPLEKQFTAKKSLGKQEWIVFVIFFNQMNTNHIYIYI